MRLLEAYEGSSDNVGSSIGQEILYENTGLSRYMAVNFAYSIADFKSWEDFEKQQNEESEADRGHYRINRVYRQMVAASALYWSRNDNPDSIYLKNQRQWIQKNFSEYLGGQLHHHKNAAFLVMDEEETFGERHPREAMLPELVLLLCGLIREKASEGVWEKRHDECIVVSTKEFQKEIYYCRDRYRLAWSKVT